MVFENIRSSYLKTEGKYAGFLGWILTTDHKRIGIMYLYGIMAFFFVGLLLGTTIRLEKMFPGQQIMDAQMYNAAFTVHGIVMIFLVVIPGLAAVFGNFILPLHIGAKDVAFPKLNLFSFWLYVIGAIVALISLFLGDGPPDTGWTFYAPYSIQTSTNVLGTLTAAFILGFSSILTGLNFIVTIHRLRTPGMGFFRMPLFVWSVYAASWIQVLATPIIGITLLMVIAEKVMRIGFFDPALGGDPLLFQHLFWIYAHPAVYIIILPSMGVMSEVIPTFSRKNIFGYKLIAFSSLAIAIVGYFVWGHHMYTAGMSDAGRWFFSLLTFFVAIPSAIKVFNWLSTLYKGSIDLKPPLLYALAYIFLIMVGGLTGMILAALATDVHLHDTSFVVAHFHYMVFGGVGFGFLSALHYWYPKMFGRMYNIRLANIACIIKVVGFNLLYFPLFIIGMQGMPRRYFDYLPMFQSGHMIATIGAMILVSGFILMFYNLFSTRKKGAQALADPWGGKTLEWTIASPPPVENFNEELFIDHGPYNYE